MIILGRIWVAFIWIKMGRKKLRTKGKECEKIQNRQTIKRVEIRDRKLVKMKSSIKNKRILKNNKLLKILIKKL